MRTELGFAFFKENWLSKSFTIYRMQEFVPQSYIKIKMVEYWDNLFVKTGCYTIFNAGTARKDKLSRHENKGIALGIALG